MKNIREVRFLVRVKNVLRKMCKLAFSDTDASLYLFPYSKSGNYYFGNKSNSKNETEYKFDFTEDIFDEKTPKLSIHEKGQVHVQVNNNRTGPLFIPHLSTLRGQHIASVTPDSFNSLPMHTEKIRNTSSEIDHILEVPDTVTNGRLLIYANGFEPKFQAPQHNFVITLERPSIPRPLHFGILTRGQAVLGESTPKGVTVIAGWDPTKLTENGFDFLYIRGE